MTRLGIPGTYVPAFPEKSAPLTCRHLLAHQGGIRHVAEDEWQSTRHYTTLESALDVFKDDPLLFGPGTRAEYTTYGFNLLGSAVEAAAEMKFADYLREHVFAPAGMTEARVDDVLEIIPNRAAGYMRLPGGPLLNSRLADTSNKIPGGGLCATASDVAHFAIALQGGVLLKKETLRSMWTAQKTKDGRKTGYGLGFLLGTSRGQAEVWHHGGQPRVSTLLYMQPERKLAIVLLANLESVSPALTELARRVAQQIGRRR
jgi:CubicO group peptidase (beta-lactamase class C family)